MNEKTRIVQGFHNNKDRQNILDKFGGYKVKCDWVHPNTYYEIIGRVGINGAWVFREVGNKRQWYLTHTLDDFTKID